ncbi:MAG: ImmA/IrrE family metallo-endopeptidase [Acidobacteriota bacterium]
MKFPVHIPKPSRFVTHAAIDEIASEIARHWIAESNSRPGDYLDVEDYAASVLGKDFDWEEIDEPAERTCFASLDGNRILLNRKYESLFKERPCLLRSSVAHEIGHVVLGHLEKLERANQPNLFGESHTRHRFHDSSLRRYDIDKEEYLRLRISLARHAAVNDAARDMLASLDDKLEPEWMFYQAEQFASCFLIPKHLLFEALETKINLGMWRSLYQLAEVFGTSISMLCVRLQKLNLIKLEGKEISVVTATAPTLFQSNA